MFVVYIRAGILYFLLVFAIRLMGKRQIGELEPSEFVVAMLIADLAAVPMQDTGIPLLSGVIPILTVLAVELILSVLSMRFRPLRRLLGGSPMLLIEDGQILRRNLARSRITVDELLQHLRQKDILDLATVRYAILEIDGQISTILYARHTPPTAMDMGLEVDDPELPMTVISDGTVLDEYLQAIGHDRAWLNRQLQHFGCRAEDVFLMTATRTGKLYVSRQEAAK